MKIFFRSLFLVACFFTITRTSTAQLNVALGAGMGYSAHGDTYEREDFFKTFQYSGYRLLVAEVRVYYNLPSRTAIWSSFRFSPHTVVSPYEYTYGSFGLEQTIPNSEFFVTAGYGVNRSFADDTGTLSEGNLTLIGVGIKNELTRFQLSSVFGVQENFQDFLRTNEFRINLVMSFNLMNHGL